METPYREDKVLIDLDNINKGLPQTDFSDPYKAKRALMTEVASGGEIRFDDALSKINTQREIDNQRYVQQKEEAKIAEVKTNILKNYAKDRDPNKPVSEEEMKAIRGLSLTPDDISSEEKLSSAIERNFAKNIVNRGVAASENNRTALREALVRNEEATDSVLKASEDFISKKRIAERVLESTKEKSEKQSWLGWGADIGKQLIPGYSWYKTQNRIAPEAGLSGVLPGTNVKEQIAYLYSLPIDQFEKILSENVDKLSADNLPLAEEFARNMLAFSDDEAFSQNFFASVDALAIGEGAASVAKGVAKVAKKGYSLGKAIRDVTREASNPKANVEDILTASGDIETAAVVNAGKQVVKNGDTAQSVKELIELRAPSIVNPDSFFTGKGALAKPIANEIASNLRTAGDDALKALNRPYTILRLDPGTEAVTKGIEKTLDDLTKIHSIDPNQSVLDVKFTPNTISERNVNEVNITLGNLQKKPFSDMTTAENAAVDLYNLKPGDFRISQEAGGFTIKLDREINEFSDAVRDVLINKDNKNPDTFMGYLLRGLRSPNYILGKSNVENRIVSVNSAEEVKGWIEQSASSLTSYLKNKDNYNNLNRILEKNRTDRAWYNTDVEFEKAWMQTFNKMPNPADYEAYVSAKRFSDLDYLVRNSEVYSYKASRGVMTFEVNAPIRVESAEAATGPFSRVAEVNKPNPSVKFDGVIVDRLPTRGERYRVLVIDDFGKSQVVDVGALAETESKALVKKFGDQGYKFVQVWDTHDPVMKQFLTKADNAPIQFVVSKEIRSSRLSVEQLPYVGGGHDVYLSGTFIKQPVIRKTFKDGKFSYDAYTGDRTLSAHRFEKEGKGFLNDLEIARKIYASGDEVALKNFVSTKFSFDVSEFKSLFHPDGFDVNTPFFLAKDGQGYKDLHDLKAKNLFDDTDTSYDLSSEMKTKFIGEKGMNVYDYRLGDTQNPVWKKTDAVHLDPLMSIQRNLGDITKSVAFKDYQVRSVNEWIEQYGDLMRASKERLRNNPQYFFNNPDFKSGPGVDKVRLAAAKQSALAIQHLMSVPSEVKIATDVAKKRLIEFVFDKNPRAGEWLDEKLMGSTSDPIKYLRGAAFHTKIGLFNPAQLFLQTQNLGNMAAISPKHAFGAYKDAFYMGLLSLTDNPKVISNIASKSGNPYFKESLDLLKDSGFLNLDGNMAVVNALAEPSVYKGKVTGALGSVLDFGTVFFKSGEKINRLGAWNIAYREWRAANPSGLVDDLAKRSILKRADDLTTNMSRASIAQMQQGFMSIPTQFMTFQWRLMEQVWTSAFGKGPFTRPEMLRMLAFTGATYGVPVGVAGPMFGFWPWHESFNEYAQKNGINVNANMISQVLSNGIYEQLFAIGTNSKYAAGERFGPAGMPTLKDAIEDKKGVLSLLTGVSGDAAIGIYKAMNPALTSVASVFGGPDKNKPLLMEDLLDAAKSISSVNNATKAWLIYNYGIYSSRTGVPIMGSKDNVSDALAQVFGLQNRDMVNFYSRKNILQDQAKALQEIVKQVEVEIGRGLKATTQKESEVFFRRARILVDGAGELSPAQKNNIFSTVLKKFTEDDIDTINRRWQLSAPTNEIQDKRIDMYKKEQMNGR